MPTLIDEYSREAETIGASGLAWIEREIQANPNDSTLSGSLLVAALDEFRRSQQQHNTASPPSMLSPAPQKQNPDQSVSLLGSPDLLAQTPHRKENEQENVDESICLLASPDLMPPPQTPHLKTPFSTTRKKSVIIAHHTRQELSPGPNQRAYEEHYKTFVHKAVEECRKKYPDQIPQYDSLSPEKQSIEQERVLLLLERLQLGCRQGADKDDDEHCCTTPAAKNNIDSPTSRGTGEQMNDSITHFSPDAANNDEVDASMALLSPTPHKNLPSQKSSSGSPIEIARGATQFSSPKFVARPEESDSQRKRIATTSGKRGADTSRRKRGSGRLLSMDLHSPQPKIFSSSQSPILSESDKEDNSRRSRRKREEEEEDDDDDSVSSTRSTISFGVGALDDSDDSYDSIDETAITGRPPLAATGNTLHLKTGATLHFQPLKTNRRRPKTKVLTQSFPDPLERYSGKAFDKMKATFKWILRRLQSTSLPGGVVFSLSEQKIIDLCTKLAIEMASDHEFVCSSHPIAPDTTIGGQTLIVLRERSSLEAWKRAFREGSNLGVISHCELPVKDRRSVSTAYKCSKYGVVLTTFDALSSPDSTVEIGDEDGTVVVEQGQDQHGWFQGRGSSESDEATTTCKRLSILHRLKWKQAIFLDSLGRKSYMAKPGTARNKAAALLATEARLVFFEKDSDSTAGFAELVKSNKKALSGVASVLHTEWERLADGDYTGEGITLDYEYALRIRTTTQRRNAKIS